MKLTVCIGSSCHLKGSRQIVETFQELIAKHDMGDKLQLAGSFCMGKCREGVCVKLDENYFSLTPETTEEFFKTNILSK